MLQSILMHIELLQILLLNIFIILCWTKDKEHYQSVLTTSQSIFTNSNV